MNVYSYVDMTRTNADGSFAVYIIVKNARGRFFVNTGMRTCGKLSDGRVFPRGDKMRQRKTTILGRYLSDVESVCLQYSVSDIGNKELKRIIQKEVFGVERKEREKTLSDYMTELSLTKKAQTAKCYMIAAKRVSEYDEKAGLRIDAEWLSRFYQWCLSRGMKVNGAGMILRNVRSTFNWARKMGYTTNYPFSEFSIVEEETLPNNLCVDDIRRLRDYPCEEWQKKYVDFFMLSFYLAGINPVDLLLMRKDALVDGHISFVRRKTNKEGSGKIRTIVLPLVDEARKIVKKYPSSEDWFLGMGF